MKCYSYCWEIDQLHPLAFNPMSNKLSNYVVKISALTLFVATSCAAFQSPAQANPFGFLDQINKTVNDINGTVNSVKGTTANTGNAIGNLTNFLGIGKSESPAANADPSDQVNGAYAAWYKGMSPAEKEIANALTSEYAEKGALDFSAFKSTDLYKAAKTSQEKQAISAMFFKYSEVVKAAASKKDKFLAFAFCVNGGSTTCK
jgi:hypothetical protein